MRTVVALALGVVLSASLASAAPPAAPQPPVDDPSAGDEPGEAPPSDVEPFGDEEGEVPPEHGGGADDEEVAEPTLAPGPGHVPLPPPVEAAPPSYDVAPTPSLDNRATDRAAPSAPAAPIVPY